MALFIHNVKEIKGASHKKDDVVDTCKKAFSVYGAYFESPSTPHLAAALGATNADPLPV